MFLLPTTTSVPASIQILFAIIEVGWLTMMSRLGFTVRVVLVKIAGFLAITFLAIFASQFFASTPPILDATGKPIPNSIAVLEKVKLGGAEEWIDYLGCVLGIALLGGLIYLCLRLGESLIEKLGKTGMGALNRIFGFLILAIAVQLISNGTLELLKTAASNLLK